MPRIAHDRITESAAPRRPKRMLYSIHEVAEYTTLSTQTIRRLLDAGELERLDNPNVRRILITRESLERFLRTTALPE